jgi:hypothetical protein
MGLRNPLLIVACLLALTSPGLASANNDSRLPADLKATLTLCGTGLLEAWGFLDVGYGSLYRPDCNRPWDLYLSEVRYMEFNYEREIPANAFRESARTLLLRQGFQDSPALEAFHRAYLDAKAGDTYALYFTPDDGLRLFLNNKLLGHLKDPRLAEGYFAIWLGTQPFDEALKQALLGQP